MSNTRLQDTSLIQHSVTLILQDYMTQVLQDHNKKRPQDSKTTRTTLSLRDTRLQDHKTTP